MNLLRRIPLSRLIVLCMIAVVAATGVAVAASAGGTAKPPRRSLAAAVRQALAAAPIPGVTAKISLTDSLIAGAGMAVPGQPLLNGGSGRLWASSDGRVRVELQSDGGDTELYVDHGAVSYYEPSSHTLYRLKLPQSHPEVTQPSTRHGVPSVADIQSALKGLMAHAGVSGAEPSTVAGKPAYRVQVTPRDGGLVGGVALWWDAAHGVPLRFAVYAAGQSSPVLQLTATEVSYTVDPSAFAVAVHPAKTIDLKLPVSPGAAVLRAGASHHPRAASAKELSATLGLPLAPRATLAGLPLTGSELVYFGGQPAALLKYGHGLGGLAVLEQRTHADPASQSKAGPAGPPNSDGQGQSLPTVKIQGSPGTVLATPLGTLVRFSHGTFTYTLLGSVRTGTALAAAREL